ncbi:MAG: hypothetical protein L0H93_08665 [Nocardioides sp.]|nr:hypothetical protein [Nocardioides sp.]
MVSSLVGCLGAGHLQRSLRSQSVVALPGEGGVKGADQSDRLIRRERGPDCVQVVEAGWDR